MRVRIPLSGLNRNFVLLLAGIRQVFARIPLFCWRVVHGWHDTFFLSSTCMQVFPLACMHTPCVHGIPEHACITCMHVGRPPLAAENYSTPATKKSIVNLHNFYNRWRVPYFSLPKTAHLQNMDFVKHFFMKVFYIDLFSNFHKNFHKVFGMKPVFMVL